MQTNNAPIIKDFIGIFPNAFSPEFCQRCIDLFHQGEAMGMLYTRQHEGAKRTEKEGEQLHIHTEASIAVSSMPGINSEFRQKFWTELYPQYINQYGVLEATDPHQIYCLKIQKTEIGQGYHIWHHEHSRANSTRLCNVMVYLNDVDDGGETEFLYYAKRVKPTAGTVVIYPAGFTHTHRGNPPLTNTKYILNGWLEF